jgi:hypothetical protein
MTLNNPGTGSNTGPGFSISMTLDDIFHTLLETKQIALPATKSGANSIRTSLLRKLKDYKIQTAALGWLTDDVERGTVSLEYVDAEGDSLLGTARFFLRPRKRSPIDYVLLTIASDKPDDADHANSN